MRCIRPGGAAAEESYMGKPTPCIAGGGHLAAIAAVLQLVGSAIRFGPFSVSLVLIPIVLGAALYGWGWRHCSLVRPSCRISACGFRIG